ncbi:MAG: NADH-quinone oxidoreductase subunit C [Opitutales bacterium]
MSALIDTLYTRFLEMFPELAETKDASTSHDEGVTPEKNAESGENAATPETASTYCRRTEHAKVGYDLDLAVEPEQVPEAARIMDDKSFALDMITGVDWPDDNQLELVYDFLHFENPARVVVRTRIPRDHPVIASLSGIYPGANWHEREAAEFYGIDFTGHPNLIHLLLPEDFQGFPLRKDFKPEPDPS